MRHRISIDKAESGNLFWILSISPKGFSQPLFSLIFFVLFSFSSLHAQLGKEANFWYFGTNAGLDFNSGVPVSVTNSAMNISEGCSSISDASGNLLFYTDGRTVYNKNHVVMGNGAGLSAGSGGSSTQGALIIKRPGSNTLYYIFTLDEQANANGLCYSVVDMTLNAGLGGVTIKNTQLYTPSTEKMTAVKHCNGVDVWLITHEKNNNTFRNFLITSAGIGAPVTSSIGTALNVGAAYSGQMKVSPTGAKLALVAYTSSNVLELFDFNNVAGTITNPLTIGNNTWGYGLEFSPNGRYLYVSDVQARKIHQLDVCAGSSAAFAASKVQIGASANSISSLQLGPDKKIYAARSNGSSTWLGVINFPNLAGAACNYVDNGVSLSAGWNQQGLPGFVQSFFRDTFPPFQNVNNCLVVNFTPPPVNCANPINAVSWNFGEPSSGSANTSTQLNPSHTYSLPGNYIVRLIVNCVDTIYKTIPVTACPLIVSSNNSSVCPGICASISANVSSGAPGYTYTWSPNIGTGPGPYNVCPTVTTVYTVTVTDLAGTTAISTSTVTVYPATNPNLVKVDVTCNGSNNGSISVNPAGGTPGYTYSWSHGPTGVSSVSNLAPGTYSVTITDANGCSIRPSATITQPGILVVPTNVISNVSCNGGSNGSATVNPAGGTPGYVYSWSNGQTSQNATGLLSGVHTVTVTDSKGCKANANVNITQPAAPVTATLTIPNHVSCFGGNNGVVSAVGGGGTPGYIYSWNFGNTNAVVSNLVAGSYSVTITDSKGCTIAGSVNVTQPVSAVTGTINIASNVTCYNGNNGSASVIAGGGTAGYSYLWSNGPTTSSNTGLNSGVYTVTVTDAKGCTFTSNINITQPAASITATVTVVNNVSCNGGNNGALTVNAAGGTGGYSYSWSGTGSATQSVSNLSAGNYSVTVTDANGCTVVASASVTQPLALTANPNVIQHVSCFGGSDGSASVSPNGGTTPYSYSWSQSGITPGISNLTAGNYSVTITDALGCTTTTTVAITQPSAPLTTTTSVVNSVSCFGGNNGSANTITAGGTIPYTYSWSNGIQASTSTGLPQGIYTVTVTDSKGCVITSTVNITQPASALTATASVTGTVSCNGGSNGSAAVAVNGGTGAYTYSWSPGGQNTQNITGLSAGSFSVIVSDANGCTAVSSISISQPAVSVTSTITVVSNVSCNGGANGSASVAASGGGGVSYSYSWSNGQTASVSTGLSATTYSVVVTDGNGCTSGATANITQPSLLTANAPVGNNVSCYGGSNGSASVVANGGTGPYTYSWSTTATSVSISNLTGGSYSVQVTDNNGCIATATVNISQPAAAVTATVSVVNNVSCYNGNNGSLIANVNGGTGPYTYAWAPVAQTNQNATGLSAGTYTATVTDAGGCTVVASNSVTQPAAALTATASVTATVTCNGGNNGSATVNASGGTGSYTYSWSNTQISQSATSLSAGSYSVTVTDANGCTAVDVVNITQPASAVSLTVTVNNNVSCNGGSNGSMSVSASGGNPGYSYVWWSGQTTTSVSGLPVGVYSATVTDANGCTSASNANITQPAVLTATINVIKNVSCYGGNDGSALVNANGGTMPYYYSWSTTGNTQSVSNLIAGAYTATVTDALGCVITATTSVTEPLAPLTGTVSVVNHVSCFGGTNGSATINAGGGTTPYNYSWSNTQTQNPATGMPGGLYTVTVTDANGCTYTDNVNITQPAAPVSITVTAIADVSCNGGSDGEAQLNAAGGTGSYTYSWSTTSTNTQVSSLSAGVYTATVTDANGCTASGNVNITQPLPININLSPSLSICDGAATTLTTAAAGGTPGYSYIWSTAETNSSINVAPAATSTYSILVTDANNCTSVATVTVTVSDPLQVVAVSMPSEICVGQSALLSANPTGGLGVNNYVWQPGGLNTSTISVNPTGSTVYTVSVSNTCGVISTTVEVIVHELPVVTFTVDDPDGCPEHCVTFSNTTLGSLSVVWAFGDGTTSMAMPDAQHCYGIPGQYSVSLTVTDTYGCSNTLAKNNYITVFPEPEAKFTASPQETSILAPTITFTDESTDADAWSWEFGDPLNSTSDEQHPVFNYSLPGTYTVQLAVTNMYGCTPDTAWLEIIVKEDYVMYVPNTFTPDGDGLNELFFPVGMGIDIESFEMYIYDRWGNLIYDTKDINKGWDGHANGGAKVAQQDTYVWKIRIIDFLGNIHPLVGHVNLIR